jgi:hypothetical protein
MRCTVCEADNDGGASECATCGKVLVREDAIEAGVEVIPGLEHTVRDPRQLDGVFVEPLQTVERTELASRDLPVRLERSFEVERTQLDLDPSAPIFWTAEPVEIERGREAEDVERTPPEPETAACPWCGTPSLDAVCDHCGRRKKRYLTAPEQPAARAASGESVMCPACFSKVADGARCSECGLPFPLREL